MFVYSVKASSVRFFVAMVLSVAVLLTLILLIPTYEPVSAETSGTISYDKIKSDADRIAFLNGLGWEVESEPVETKEVTIPAEFDAVFLEYNNLQKMQGLDLSRYKRKSVVRYTYKITNYKDYDGTVYANLLIYRNKIVGGDICSADSGGFVATFDNRKV
ncbi:MAG: DUF4830 domain-containing protein [Eubacteriales bacterium]